MGPVPAGLVEAELHGGRVPRAGQGAGVTPVRPALSAGAPSSRYIYFRRDPRGPPDGLGLVFHPAGPRLFHIIEITRLSDLTTALFLEFRRRVPSPPLLPSPPCCLDSWRYLLGHGAVFLRFCAEMKG